MTSDKWTTRDFLGFFPPSGAGCHSASHYSGCLLVQTKFILLTSSENVGGSWVSYHLYVAFMGSWAEMGLLCFVGLLGKVF